MKTQPIGTCDHCLGPIPADEWYTRRGPRRYCCIDCRNTANSRNGEPVRHAKMMERVEAGEWVNPRSLMTPEEISAAQSEASRKGRLREVAEGRWRNPALTDAARAKLSRPRKHHGLLHTALEKLTAGKRMAELTVAERRVYHAYRTRLKRKR